MSNNKYSDTELLNQYNLPVFHNLSEFSNKIGLSEKTIYLFSYQNNRYYKSFQIPKRNGTTREIFAPSFQLKLVQKWILVNIFSKLAISDNAKAFKKGLNGIKSNAEFHKNRLYILQIDLKDFFTTIKRDRIFNLLRKKGYNSEISGIIANICTNNGSLPQGGICSPVLSNLICNSLDKRLTGLCNKRDVLYSRYADDMTFSSNDKNILKRIKPIIKKIIEDEDFIINDSKTRFLSKGSRKTITGVNINTDFLKASKALKKKVRAMIYNSIINGNYDNNEKIRGIVSFVNSIEDDFKVKIINYINGFERKLAFNKNNLKLAKLYNDNKIFAETKKFSQQNIDPDDIGILF